LFSSDALQFEPQSYSTINATYLRRLGTDPNAETYYYLFPAKIRSARPISRACLRRLPQKARRRQVHLEREDRARGVGLVLATRSGPSPELALPPFIVGHYSAEELLTGKAWSGPSGSNRVKQWRLSGVVPDGVASVTLVFADGTSITQVVVENFWLMSIPSSSRDRVATFLYHSPSGQTIKTLTGQLIPTLPG
jgi:hypothetical protein